MPAKGRNDEFVSSGSGHSTPQFLISISAKLERPVWPRALREIKATGSLSATPAIRSWSEQNVALIMGFARVYCPQCRHDLPARVFMQGEIFLPELPSETRARLRRLGRAASSRCSLRCTAPAIRVHPAASCARFRAQAQSARKALSNRRTPAYASIRGRRLSPRPDCVRPGDRPPLRAP